MKKAKEFVLSRLRSIVEEFPLVQFKYEYDDVMRCHKIEVSPLHFHKNSGELKDKIFDIVDEIYDNDLDEIITFFSEESLIKIEPTDIVRYNIPWMDSKDIKAKKFNAYIYTDDDSFALAA